MMDVNQDKIEVAVLPIADEIDGLVKGDIRIFYDGEACPYVELSGPVEKRYIGYESIKNDLEICRKVFLDIVNTNDRDPYIQNALWESFITKYARNFVSTEGRGIKLEERQVFRGDLEWLLETHKYLIRERHNFSAHAGITDLDNISGRLALLPPSKGRGLLTFYMARDVSLRSEDKDTKAIIALLEEMIDWVCKQLGPIKDKIEEIYSRQSVDELYARSK
ncbi:hypothetical protein [Microbulbifer sp. ZKSA002]|uniref:hypothetical protein n=1 Tax=Microbulbifer sp. ZKSA002 TaxID=3243388 RepID=UPI0040398987